MPRSRSSSRSNLRRLNSDTDSDIKKSESDGEVYLTHEPLQGKPNVDFPEKKWDLDEEDLDLATSEGGASEFPQRSNDSNVGEQPKITGRRSLRDLQQAAQAESPSSYSPSSYAGSPPSTRQPTGAIQRPTNVGRFFGEDRSPISDQSPSPVLTQTVGLPSPPLNNRSTEV